jgi:hypothetical protein
MQDVISVRLQNSISWIKQPVLLFAAGGATALSNIGLQDVCCDTLHFRNLKYNIKQHISVTYYLQ